MSATILQFPRPPAARDQALTAQPSAPASTKGAGALSPAQELYMDGYLERGITDSCEQLQKAQTSDAQRYWFKVMQRLLRLRSSRQIEAMERAKGLR